MQCWSCGKDNDLDTAQTCAYCGAPLAKSSGVFSKPVLFAVIVLGLLIQAFCVFPRLIGR